MNARGSLHLSSILLLIILIGASGCSKAPTDAQIASDIQARLSADSGLQGKQLIVQAANGSVTLSGTVDNDAERDAAAKYASSVPGVKQVVNNLQVAPPSAPTQTAQAAPMAEEAKPAPSTKRHHESSHRPKDSYSAGDNSSSQMPAPAQTSAPAPAPVVQAPPPPPPPPQKVTIPSGTTLAVRLVDPIDSETAQSGQTFHTTLNAPLTVDGETAVPAGYEVVGHLVTVQSAGKFAGQSLLVMQLDNITVAGKSYAIQTDQYKKQGSSRGKNTAEKVGGGALLGAIIGGIAGGGKGAAIGATAGGGLGAGAQAVTHGQQIKLEPETVLNFTLQAPLSVIPTAQGPNSSRPKLDNNQ